MGKEKKVIEDNEKGLMRQIWDGDITSADKDSLTKEQKAMIKAVVMLMEKSVNRGTENGGKDYGKKGGT